MPTLCGLRRRGYTPVSIRNFCDRIGVAKATYTVEYGFLGIACGRISTPRPSAPWRCCTR